MSDDDGRPRSTQVHRYEFLEWKLFWEGQVNRSDLKEAFRISTPQASVDFRNYREFADDNIEYDSTEKGYLPSSKFSPRYLRVSADRLLLQLRALVSGVLKREDVWFRNLPSFGVAPDIVRSVDPDCLRSILKAMRSRQAIDIRYQSMTSSQWRAIVPHALAFDGHRWHVRAWCCVREAFLDFVLARIDGLGTMRPMDIDPADDLEWQRMVTLRLCPHPGLNGEQRKAIQKDYGMTDGCLQVEVRTSLAYYFLTRMNLDLPDLPDVPGWSPARIQIQLENLAEVKAAIQAAKDESAALVTQRRA